MAAASAVSVVMIVAVDLNGAIGKDGQLPWGRTMPSDLAHFREITKGKPVIMGRRTFESLNGRVLGEGRTMIVVTSEGSTNRLKYTRQQALVAACLRDAISIGRYFATIHGADEVCVIGGARLYSEALDLCRRVYLTRIHTCVDKPDAWFNEFNLLLTQAGKLEWKCKERALDRTDTKDAHDATFMTFSRSTGP